MKPCVFIAAAGALAYAVLWLLLGYPYRPFPSDDVWAYFPSLTQNTYAALSDTPGLLHPMLRFNLIAFKLLWSAFSRDLLSTFLFAAAVTNAATLFLTTLIVFKLTGSMTAAACNMALFGTSAWPVNYCFFYCHAPSDGMLVALIFFCIICAYLRPGERNALIAAAGLVSGAMFWSTPQSILIIPLLFLVLAVLFPPFGAASHRKVIFVYGVALWCAMAPLFSAAPRLIEALRLHGARDEMYLACDKFGFMPRIYLGNFFYTLGTYSAVISAAYVTASVLFVAMMLAKRRAGDGGHAYSRREHALLALLMFVWLYASAFGMLPARKMARSIYFTYPLILATLICIAHLIMTEYCRRYRYPLGLLLFGLGAYCCAANALQCAEIRHVRTAAPAYLKGIGRSAKLYVRDDDPHAEYLEEWLKDYNVRRVKEDQLDRLLDSGERVGLMVGPHGSGSGTSILANACLDDYHYDPIQDERLMRRAPRKVVLPYYSFFPTFLLEEECCQALYFMGLTPDYKSDQMNLTLLLFENRSAEDRPPAGSM